ncbi:MAG TPA: sensor histidine kinase [Firmicutes bacterium]|jgi:two-component system sensor histidine kinase YesM|nr:sensor histidine kinase [Bacillota bacterium]
MKKFIKAGRRLFRDVFRLRSLRTKFIISFTGLILIPLILLAFLSYYTYLEILQQNVRTYTETVINRVERNLQIYLSDLERILELRNDYYILQFLKLSMIDDIEGNQKYTYRLWENLNNIKKYKTDLREVAITTLKGVKIGCYGVTNVDLSQNELFQILANRTTQDNIMAIYGPHDDWLGGKVFSVGCGIYGDYDNFLGIMSIDVEIDLLARICSDIRLGKTGYVTLVDQNGQIIFHPQAELVGKSVGLLLGNPVGESWRSGYYTYGNRVIMGKTLTLANWSIIGISDRAELVAEMTTVARMSFALIVGSIIVVILVALLLAGVLTKPLKELQSSMRAAADNLNTIVPVRTYDEIGQLGRTFNQMLTRIRRLMRQSVQEQKKLRQIEMRALQEQIKPHFIYNTLEVIIGLLETNQNEDVIRMVEALGAFFRISLSQGRELIRIKEEVDHVRNYLYIQKLRHGEKYDYRFEVENDITHFKTLKLLLQPLVENAIYHGVRSLESNDGLIIVKGYQAEEMICFEVIDNGRGMPASQVTAINRYLRGERLEEQEKYGFGLRNVHERIVLAFGQEYGLWLTSTLDQGTKVVLRLPLIKEDGWA